MEHRAFERSGGRGALGLIALILSLFAATPTGRANAPGLRAGVAHRGVAVLSSVIGHEIPEQEIEDFVKSCNIDLLVIDFCWITHHFDRTNMAAVEALSRRLQQTGVVVAAMYRPRALWPEQAAVHFARDENGAIAENHNELCFAHADSTEWGASWGDRILEALPSVDHILLYNVRSLCRCDSCLDGRGQEHAAAFIRECRERWRAIEPQVRVGHVGSGLQYAEHLDFLCPFVSGNRNTPDEAVDAVKAIVAAAAVGQTVRTRPVVPLVKICYSDSTRNTTSDITNLIETLEQRGLGFLLWYYSWIFHPDQDRYEPASVVRALGGDHELMAPHFERGATDEPSEPDESGEPGEPAPAPGSTPYQWVYFDSLETSSGPTLVLTGRSGRVLEYPAVADTTLMSYQADQPVGLLEKLSVSLGDTNRVLLRFDVKELRRLRRVKLAHVRLRSHPSELPPPKSFEMVALRVTEPWQEGEATWNRQPATDPQPIATALVPPNECDVLLDVTAQVNAWMRHPRRNHGLLLRIKHPVRSVTPAEKPDTPKEPWTQPPIRTGTPFSDTIPWADTLEEALVLARRQGKPLLVTVVPIDDRRWCSGYAEAEAEWGGHEEHDWGDERAMAIDGGLVKERAMMAALFSDPEIVHLVKSHFVPVRLRLYVFRFQPDPKEETPDPLHQVGTTATDVGGPGLVFAREDGRLLHSFRRMGVFSAPMVRAMLVAVLGRAGVEHVEPFLTERHATLTRAWELVRDGLFLDAARRLERWRPGPDSALAWERIYLVGHVADRLGDEARARAAWQQAVEGDPDGPWGSKAAVRLMPRELRLDEWETLYDFPFDPLAQGTEVRVHRDRMNAVIERAVDYLLRQQRPNGSWQDPFVDVFFLAGPGSSTDKAVPRTGLVVDALLDVRDRLPGRRREIEAAIERGIDFVGEFADAPEPHIWKVTYALHLQVELLETATGRALDRARERAERLVAMLAESQVNGGWTYMLPPRVHSFNTAPVLLFLSRLRELGVDVPAEMTDAAAAFLEGLRDQEEPRKFYYATNTRHQAIRSSSCRTALCELALLEHAGGGDVAGLRAGVELFFEHQETVRQTTKVFELFFSPAAMHDAYHYFFGHYYTALALAHLPAREARSYARRQINILLGDVEIDGSFVDAQMQGKANSTAMALLTLLEDLRYTGPVGDDRGRTERK